MTPSTKATAGAKGGRSRSVAKLSALAALHAARRGVPVHPEPPAALASLRRLHQRGLRSHGSQLNPWSIAAIAREIGVDNRTLRRWLAGVDRPAQSRHPDIERAAEVMRAGV